MTERIKRILVFLLLVAVLAMAGCNQESPAETTLPSEVSTTPSESINYLDIYRTAVADMSQRQDLVLEIRYSDNRTVDGVAFRKSGVGTAIYADLGSANMEALIREKLTFGSYEADYTQSYLDGKAYTQVSGTSFVSNLTAEEFLTYQIPSVLIDPDLYESVTWEGSVGDSITYRFAQPSGFEDWANISQDAQLVGVTGSATVDEEGILRESSYHIQYTIGDVACSADVAVAISFPSQDSLSQQPEYPQSCVQLDAYLAPRLILQTVGSVYTLEDMTSVQTDTLYCQAASLVRTQQVMVDTFGSGNNFMAQVGYSIKLTDYTNTPTTNTRVETFRDGSYTYSINGGDPVAESGINASQMREYAEDTILSTLLTPEFIASAVTVDTGDFYCIQFTCTDAYTNTIFKDIYKLLNVDLDNFAQSFTTETGTAYLTINKHTGLPATIGRSFTRTHVIDKVSYQTTYHLDQTLTLPSKAAYGNITGQKEQETEPQTKATPLFYKVTDSKGRTLWMLGTIHIGDNRTGFLPQQILDAFHTSDSLAVEFDTIAFEQQAVTDPTLQAQLASIYYYTDGSATANHLDSELYQKAYALILASGSNNRNVSKMKPAFWESLLQTFYIQQDGTLCAEQGMDHRLLTMARQQEKTIQDIESGIAQMKILSDFSEDLQAMLLEETVSYSLSSYCEEICQLYEAWCQGDEATLTQLVTEDTSAMTDEELVLYKEYHKAITTDRNATMLKAAKSYIKSGKTVFFAVGLAHLLGEEGLVTQLRNAGYTVELVTYN